MKVLKWEVTRGQSKKTPLKENIKQPDTLIQAISQHMGAHVNYPPTSWRDLGIPILENIPWPNIRLLSRM